MSRYRSTSMNIRQARSLTATDAFSHMLHGRRKETPHPSPGSPGIPSDSRKFLPIRESTPRNIAYETYEPVLISRPSSSHIGNPHRNSGIPQSSFTAVMATGHSSHDARNSTVPHTSERSISSASRSAASVSQASLPLKTALYPFFSATPTALSANSFALPSEI